MDRHMGWHHRVKKGDKMEMAAATFFGTGGVEEFIGVTTTPDDKIVAIGNSWGPPFPACVTPAVLGPDQLWDVPLYPPGKEVDKGGFPLKPPDTNPNKTGFLVFYSDDLTKAESALRFGWGLANISACCITADRHLVITGSATRNFRTLAQTAKMLKIFPKPEDKTYGVVEYEGVTNPGDVYVAKLTPDLKTFVWVWILEGHRDPPAKIYEGRGGEIVFGCQGLKRITGDVQTLEAMSETKYWGRSFMGVSPVDGTWLIGGDHQHPTGREPWRRPRLLVFTPEGNLKSRLYDWPGPLVGHDNFRLVSDSAARVASFLPNGHIVVIGWSDGGNSVFTRNPVDLEKGVKSMGLNFDGWGCSVGSFAHVARFDPNNYEDCSYIFWCSYMQTIPNSMGVDAIRGAKDGSVILLGDSPWWLVQTTTNWYQAANQYLQDVELGAVFGKQLYHPNGWPIWTGVGGRGGYCAVFTADFGTMLWSSAIARSKQVDAVETRRGVAVVGSSLAVCTDVKQRTRDPGFVEHDIAYWPEFLAALASDAQKSDPTPAKQIWKFLSDDLKTAIRTVKKDDKSVPADVQTKVYEELTVLLAEKGFYDEAAWKDWTCERAGYHTPIPAVRHEKTLLAKHKSDQIAPDELRDLNRRLLERAFPKYVFRAPKENQPAFLHAVQEEFGGGYSDGHIYLLVRSKTKRED
jgi:hypothetical protein